MDHNGWTWVTRNENSKSIGNPFQKALENVATSFYMTNMPPALTPKGLWTLCAPHGKLVDAFITNKLSKGDVEPDLEGENKDGEKDESIVSPNKKLKEDIKTTKSDLSRPPGFEFMKKSSSSTSKFSTSFASHRKSDIKGVSLINELNQIIEVGTALGYDVRGCKKNFKQNNQWNRDSLG
ncbi:hypothetical protein Tco_1444882 [Tanacetum coccineum]